MLQTFFSHFLPTTHNTTAQSVTKLFEYRHFHRIAKESFHILDQIPHTISSNFSIHAIISFLILFLSINDFTTLIIPTQLLSSLHLMCFDGTYLSCRFHPLFIDDQKILYLYMGAFLRLGFPSECTEHIRCFHNFKNHLFF